MRTINSEKGHKQMNSYEVVGFHKEFYFNPGLYANEDNIDETENHNGSQNINV